MSGRLIALCLLAYPRAVRRRDGRHLRELALDLAEGHGHLREAVGLVRGGLAERWRHGLRPTRTALAVCGALGVVAVLVWAAVAGPVQVEEEVVTCVGAGCEPS